MGSEGGFDAFLLLSFGGPEGPEDVLPFLENVTRGRGIPRERLAEVAEHYRHFGGVSPINEQCRRLLAAIQADFAAHGLDLPCYWGNRNWHPMLVDTLARMRDDGVRRAVAFVTSAYGSYSACRQYLDDIAAARAVIGADAPVVGKLRHFHDHPGFVEPHADALRAALDSLDPALRGQTRVAFTAHSVPVSMAASSGPGQAGSGLRGSQAHSSAPTGLAGSGLRGSQAHSSAPTGGRYQAQLRETASLVAGLAAPDLPWDLVWQSRSGPPQVPWLEPDVNDHLEALAAAGTQAVAVSPIGFVSDHLEVIWDLDNEAAQTAKRLGLGFARAATPGVDPRFVGMVRELVQERVNPGDTRPRRGLGTLPVWDECPAGCCPAPGRGRT